MYGSLFKFQLYFAQVLHGPMQGMHHPHCHPL